MVNAMQAIKDKIFICYTKSDKKIKEKSIYINELANYEQLTVSSKTNDNIFELQKKIIEIL
jgi:hypothetical protein